MGNIFEGGIKSSASETMKKFDNTASEDKEAIGKKLGSGRVVSDQVIAGNSWKLEVQFKTNEKYLFFYTMSTCHELLYT